MHCGREARLRLSHEALPFSVSFSLSSSFAMGFSLGFSSKMKNRNVSSKFSPPILSRTPTTTQMRTEVT